MSHDRKPGRVRVMSSAGETPQRRRDDTSPVVIDNDASPPALPAKAKGRSASARARLVLMLLFVLGAAAGGAGVVAAGLT